MNRFLYDLLGVSTTASAETIKQHYRRQAKKYHPDRNPGDDKAEERYKQVVAAFEVLSDPDRRKRYDETGETDDEASRHQQEMLLRVLSPILMETFEELVKKGRKVESVDVVAEFRKVLFAKQKEAADVLTGLKENKRVLEATLGRFKVDDGSENLLVAIVRGQLRELEDGMSVVRTRVDIISKGIKLMAAYRYEHQPVGPQHATFRSNELGFAEFVKMYWPTVSEDKKK